MLAVLAGGSKLLAHVVLNEKQYLSSKCLEQLFYLFIVHIYA
jgi:hypothetical protein